MAVGESRPFNDTEMRLRYLETERGNHLTRVSSDTGGGNPTFTLTRAFDNTIVGSAGASLATVKTHSPVVDPTI
jgi:hypothetical protein